MIATKKGKLTVLEGREATYRAKIAQGRLPAYAAATTLVKLEKNDTVQARIDALGEPGILEEVLVAAGVSEPKPAKKKAPAKPEPADKK